MQAVEIPFCTNVFVHSPFGKQRCSQAAQRISRSQRVRQITRASISLPVTNRKAVTHASSFDCLQRRNMVLRVVFDA